MELKLLFENAAFVVVDKPAGVLTTPSRLGAADPRPCLGEELQRQLGRQIFPVHRLDEEVSGIVLFALTPESHRAAQKWFEDRAIQKTYHALTVIGPLQPEIQPNKETWKSLLLRGKKRAYESPHGQEAVTEAQWLGERSLNSAGGKIVWEWLLQPVTGRAHQLRFECAKHRVPILGDTLYGGPTIEARGIQLRHTCLRFSDGAQALWRMPAQIEVNRL